MLLLDNDKYVSLEHYVILSPSAKGYAGLGLLVGLNSPLTASPKALSTNMQSRN